MEAKINGEDTGLLEHVKGFYMDFYGLSAKEAEKLLDSIVGDI
jgi:hypothetical protein